MYSNASHCGDIIGRVSMELALIKWQIALDKLSHFHAHGDDCLQGVCTLQESFQTACY